MRRFPVYLLLGILPMLLSADRPDAAPQQNSAIPAPASSDSTAAGISPENIIRQSEVYLQIRAGAGASLIGIGIEGFTAPAAADPVNTVRKTLEEDLRASGLFQVRTLSDSLSAKPGSLFLRWKAAGAAYYLVGESGGVGGSVSVKLYDLTTGLTRFEAEYLVERNRPWYTGHVIVDDIIQLFTGLRGSFASRIACIGRTGSGNEILIIDADGRRRSQLTFSRTMNMSPAWSPKSDMIAYSAFNGSNWAISAIRVETGTSRTVSRGYGQNLSPAWNPVSPDVIAFSSNRDGNNEIYLMRQDGSGIRRLTNNPWIDVSPAWSPDGTRIAFTSDRTGIPAVYLMGSDGTGQRRLTSIPNSYEDSPSWSPRGDRIAFVIRTGSTGAEIATASPDGGNVLMLTMGEGSNEDPEWSPDGLRIVFTSTRLGGKKLFIMNSDGSGVHPLTPEGSFSSPSWSSSASGDDIRISRR